MEKTSMTLNNIISKYNLIIPLKFEHNQKEFSKDLKLKIIKMKIEYGKYKKALDNDITEFAEGIISERYKFLTSAQFKTEEETKELSELQISYQKDINDYMASRAREIIENVNDWKISESEYEEIVDINATNDVEINGIQIPALDYLELIYNLLVEKNKEES